MTPEEEAKFNAMAATINDLVDAVRKLAAVTQPRINEDEQLEWSIDAKDWVFKKKLEQLKKAPRW